jgi:uncharacterized membrane protein
MLFYEPSFVTFFAAFCALYLLATASVTKKSALLIASVLFYLWGEPVFVLVLKVPQRSRRLALTVENEFLIGRFSYVDEVLKVVGR